MSDTIRILIAEDVDLIADAFQALLGTVNDFEVVCRVDRGDLVASAVAEHDPDIAILDVDMPGATGIEAAATVPDCKVLLLTALEGPGHMHKALEAGANGYLLKTTTGPRLIDAVRTIVAGGTVIDSDLAVAALRSGPNPLTDREIDILRLVRDGVSTDRIAKELFLSDGTVRNYLSNAMLKLDARTRVEAYQAAQGNGWL